MKQGPLDYSKETDLEVLRARIEELEKFILGARPVLRMFRLTETETKIVMFLASRVSASKEQIYINIYNSWHEVHQKIIDVFICKIRRKLPADVRIETIWGRGYAMPPECRAAWAEYVKAAEESM
jgi:DNA-binding response OmpR family regulator